MTSPANPPVTNELCSHAGSCADNAREFGGAFCANPPVISELAEHHRSQCNRYVNGQCTTAACMKRGGWVPTRHVDYSLATCEAHETVVALEASQRLLERDERMREALEAILKHAPSLPEQYAWSGQAEALFDNGLRHKRGKKPFDYLKSWLSMLRPFAYATRDDSWGEMEKLLCIVMRNYVRVAAASDKARTSEVNGG